MWFRRTISPRAPERQGPRKEKSMSNHDIDALMRKAFNLPAPPRPALPKDAEKDVVQDVMKDVMKDVHSHIVVPGDAPGLDVPLLLSDELLDTLVAAGPSVQLVQPIQPIQPVEQTSGIPSAAPGSANKKNWP